MDMRMGIRNFYNIVWKHRIPQLLFYLGLTIELVIVIIDKSNYINPIEGLLFRITFLLFALKVLTTSYTWKQWLLIAFLELIAFVSYRTTGRNDVIRIVTFAAACKGIPLKQMLRYVFYVTLAGCIAIVFLAVTGIYGEMSLTTDFGRADIVSGQGFGPAGYTQTRYTLGMGHPNALSCMFLMLLAMGIYIYAEKMKWYVYLFLMLLNIGVYGLTDSKTSMLITTLLLLTAFLMSYSRFLREKKIAYLGGVLVFIFCVGFSIDAAAHAVEVEEAHWEDVYLGERTMGRHVTMLMQIDRHINGRIVTLAGTTDNNGALESWSAFSCPNNMNYYFDMGWVKLFYRFGIVPGFLYCIACLALLWKFYRRKDAFGLVVFTILAVYSIVEAHLFSVYIGRNFLLLMMGSLFLGETVNTESI